MIPAHEIQSHRRSSDRSNRCTGGASDDSDRPRRRLRDDDDPADDRADHPADDHTDDSGHDGRDDCPADDGLDGAADDHADHSGDDAASRYYHLYRDHYAIIVDNHCVAVHQYRDHDLDNWRGNDLGAGDQPDRWRNDHHSGWGYDDYGTGWDDHHN